MLANSYTNSKVFDGVPIIDIPVDQERFIGMLDKDPNLCQSGLKSLSI